MMRYTPWWLPRKSKVIASRTWRLASGCTAMLTAKRSMENARPWACAAAAPATTARRAASAATPGRRRPTRASGAVTRLALGAAGKRHLGDLAVLGAVKLEVSALDEAEEQRDLVGREALHRCVQVPHHGVVVAPCTLDVSLDLAQRLLERLEILVGLQPRVRLGDGKEVPEGIGELTLRAAARFRGLGAHRRPPRLHDVLEGSALVVRISPHALDEIRNEIGAPLELHVDVRPRLLGALPQGHEAVVHHHRAGGAEPEHDQEDHEPHGMASPSRCVSP